VPLSEAIVKNAPRPSTHSMPSVGKLGGLTPWQLTRKVWAEIGSKHLLGRASELAFDFLFALFPLILFMLTLFGLFASHRVELQQDFLSYFADFLPPTAFDLLRKTTAELAAHAGEGKLTIGILLALWFASGGVTSMISALNLAYRVDETRSWLRVRAIALALTLGISILLFAALILVLISGRVTDWLGAQIGLEPAVVAFWKIAQWPAAIIFLLLSFSLIYFFGPNSPQKRWHWLTPGSAFGTCMWLLGSVGFRAYLRFLNSYSASYGSLGAVMVLLAWLYIAGLSFLIGGEINAQIEIEGNGEHEVNSSLS
jgi:membrane protein